jgi:hypothetical protein
VEVEVEVEVRNRFRHVASGHKMLLLLEFVVVDIVQVLGGVRSTMEDV